MDKKLQRFIDAHKENFQAALSEIKAGRKRSHWMWFIFPQIKGLGRSDISKYYAIESIEEAKAFFDDPYLGQNLVTITSELLNLKTNNATLIFGSPDDMKLLSSMTLFSLIFPGNQVFKEVLDRYFQGKKDQTTLRLLNFEER